MTTAAGLWQALQEQLRSRLDGHLFEHFVLALGAEELENRLVLIAPNEHFIAALTVSDEGVAPDCDIPRRLAEAFALVRPREEFTLEVKLDETTSTAAEDAPQEREDDDELQPYDELLDALREVRATAPLSTFRKVLLDMLPDVLRDASKLLVQETRTQLILVLSEKRIPDVRSFVDAAIASTLPGQVRSAGKTSLLDDEPWHEEVDGREVLDEIARQFDRYVSLPAGASTTLALWTMFAHAIDAFVWSPRLAVTSPVKGCGKTTLFGVLKALCPRAIHAGHLSPAALYRTVDADCPTLLIDEADTVIAEGGEDLRRIINMGHLRGAHVVKMEPTADGRGFTTRYFSAFCPMALALIGGFTGRWTTVEDRSIEIPMRRNPQAARLEHLRPDRQDHLVELRRMAMRWAADSVDRLRNLDPEMPRLRSARAQDNWRPLVAIADLAGGEWPERGRAAAPVHSGRPDPEDAAELLLADIRDVFDHRPADETVLSLDLVNLLGQMEERPWSEWRLGRPMTASQLATELRRFRIAPRAFKVKSRTLRGYRREQFEDAWARYCPAGEHQFQLPLHPVYPPPPPICPQPRNSPLSTAFSPQPAENRGCGLNIDEQREVAGLRANPVGYPPPSPETAPQAPSGRPVAAAHCEASAAADLYVDTVERTWRACPQRAASTRPRPALSALDRLTLERYYAEGVPLELVVRATHVLISDERAAGREVERFADLAIVLEQDVIRWRGTTALGDEQVERYRALRIAQLSNGWQSHPAFRNAVPTLVARTIDAIAQAPGFAQIQEALAALVKHGMVDDADEAQPTRALEAH